MSHIWRVDFLKDNSVTSEGPPPEDPLSRLPRRATFFNSITNCYDDYPLFRTAVIALAVGASVGVILIVTAVVFGLKRCWRAATARNSMARMAENSSCPSLARPRSPHLSHHPSFADPLLPQSFQLTGHQSSSHPRYPTSRIVNCLIHPILLNPSALLQGKILHPPQHHPPPTSLSPPPQTDIPAVFLCRHNAMLTMKQYKRPYQCQTMPGHQVTLESSRMVSVKVYRHYSPQFGVGQVVSPMTGAQHYSLNQPQYPVSQARNLEDLEDLGSPSFSVLFVFLSLHGKAVLTSLIM